jgi:predicted negative regulator of RcsB-dependent stress response
VEDYLSEREQLDKLKGGFREYAPWAIAGIVLAVGGLYGWNKYQQHKVTAAIEASSKLEAMVGQIESGDVAAAGKAADELRANAASTPYADHADLLVARALVDKRDYAGALARLEAVILGTRDAELKAVAQLRKARVQRALGKPDEAMKTLDAVLAGSGAAQLGNYAAAFLDVKGDLLADKGDAAGAAAAWKQALEQDKEGVLAREIVELKLNQAGGAPPAAAVAPAAPTGAAQ